MELGVRYLNLCCQLIFVKLFLRCGRRSVLIFDLVGLEQILIIYLENTGSQPWPLSRDPLAHIGSFHLCSENLDVGVLFLHDFVTWKLDKLTLGQESIENFDESPGVIKISRIEDKTLLLFNVKLVQLNSID